MSLRPNKVLTKKTAIALAPEYVEFFRDVQKGDGRIVFPRRYAALHSNLGLYVKLYEDERYIAKALALWIYGEEGFKELASELEAASADEQQAFLDEMMTLGNDASEELDDFPDLPTTEDEWMAAEAAFKALPPEEQKIAARHGSFFWVFFFSSLFNTLSLMVHGARLTTLVPLAMSGDDEAFLKAVQIDRMLPIHHPYFRDRKREAQDRGETKFLRQLLTREIGPPLRSRIRYPGLYMLFGILQAFQWLDDMTHEEILDLVDAARLDRYQNRVEDVNYLTKRLGEYRNWQNLNALSMQ
jgi:hypothetical protein